MKNAAFLTIVLTALAFSEANRATADVVSYTYDAAGRLSSAVYSTQAQIAYVYDSAGNIISRIITSTAASPALRAAIEPSVPVPETVAVLSTAGFSGRPALIQWTAVPGKTYRVQYKDDLSDPSWTDLPGDVIAANGAACKSDSSPPATKRFYRIVALP